MNLAALYLLLDLFTLSFPLIRSWDKKLSYHKKWKAVFPSLLIVGIVFLIWDILFTKAGIWGFNPTYLLGLELINLPIEEWLFFLVVPFACLFIYEATLYYIPARPLRKVSPPFFIFLAIFLIVIGLLNIDKIYTSLTFLSTAVFIFFHLLVIKRSYLDRFLIGYLFSLVPFLLVNGVLTGTFIPGEIVWYNNDENLGIRLSTIPVEDAIYLLLYLMSIITIYEELLDRFPLLGINNN